MMDIQISRQRSVYNNAKNLLLDDLTKKVQNTNDKIWINAQKIFLYLSFAYISSKVGSDIFSNYIMTGSFIGFALFHFVPTLYLFKERSIYHGFIQALQEF